MIGRIVTAYRIELIKALRSKFSYIGPVLVVLLVLLSPLLNPLTGGGENAYRFIAFATPTALNLLGLFLVLSFCASLVSGETGTGSIRLLLTRPLLRHEFIVAKLLIGLTYAFTLSLLVAVVAWGIGITFGSISGNEYGGESCLPGAMLRAYLLGFALNQRAVRVRFLCRMVSTFMRAPPRSSRRLVFGWYSMP